MSPLFIAGQRSSELGRKVVGSMVVFLLAERAPSEGPRPTLPAASVISAARLLRHHLLTHRCILRNVSQTSVQSFFFNSCRDTVLARVGLVHGTGFAGRPTGHRRTGISGRATGGLHRGVACTTTNNESEQSDPQCIPEHVGTSV